MYFLCTTYIFYIHYPFIVWRWRIDHNMKFVAEMIFQSVTKVFQRIKFRGRVPPPSSPMSSTSWVFCPFQSSLQSPSSPQSFILPSWSPLTHQSLAFCSSSGPAEEVQHLAGDHMFALDTPGHDRAYLRYRYLDQVGWRLKIV